MQKTDTQQVPTVVTWAHDHQEKDAIERTLLAGQGRRCLYSPLVGNRGSGDGCVQGQTALPSEFQSAKAAQPKRKE